MIVKLCAKCRKPIMYPNRYCPACKEKYQEEEVVNERVRNKRYNQNRNRKYIAFYKSPEWCLLKNKKLQDTAYMCERCKQNGKHTIATEVHHIKEIQTEEGWNKRLDYNNLTSVCVECHNWYHNRFKRREKQR